MKYHISKPPLSLRFLRSTVFYNCIDNPLNEPQLTFVERIKLYVDSLLCGFIGSHTKKKVKNEGQLPQYYVKNSHEAIIPPELFDAVQAERKRRSIHGKSRDRKTYPFTGKIICGKCGKNYRRKTTSAGIRWVCSTYNTYGKEFCDAKQIPEDVLESIVANRDFRQICALDEHTLKIIWADGTESTHHRENHSRSESWTAEMREKARARSLKCQRNL